MSDFRVVCINSSNRPNEIPINLWVEKDEVYTVTNVDYMNMQNRLLGCKLAELNIDNCFPYQYFALSRFRPFTDEDAKALEAVENLLKEVEEYAEIH